MSSSNMTDPSPVRTIHNDYSHYTPLSSESKQIRLLRILPAASPDEPLVVAVVRTMLATCPPYTALSYCWGSLDETLPVTVLFQDSLQVDSKCGHDEIQELNDGLDLDGEDGVLHVVRDFRITTNLHAALHSCRTRNVTAFIWNDMLCINQGDVHERSDQVSFMKSVYAAAESVTVWLGTDQKYADALFVDGIAELVIFKEALEFWGWNKDQLLISDTFEHFWRGFSVVFSPDGDRKMACNQLDDGNVKLFWPRQLDGEHSYTFTWSGKLPTSSPDSFHRSLLRLTQMPSPLTHEGRREEFSALVSNAGMQFLIWLHFPHLKALYDDSSAQTEPTRDALLKYKRRIASDESVVWRVVAHAVAFVLERRNDQSLLHPISDRTKRILENP